MPNEKTNFVGNVFIIEKHFPRIKIYTRYSNISLVVVPNEDHYEV